MRGGWIFGAVAAFAIAGTADAAVMCTKAKKGVAKEGAPIKLRATSCLATEVEVDPVALGLQGPAGTAGAQGNQGNQGLQGEQGPPGLSAVEVITGNGNAVITSSGTSTATASCPGGKKVLGGGAAFVSIAGGSISDQRIDVSSPVTTDPQGWTATMTASVTDDWRVDAYAVCATVAE
jgi:hypothetical protein